MRDPWVALGIARGASRQQIKEAYRALAKKYHPDLCEASTRAEAEVRFKLINEARTQLLAFHGGGWRGAAGGVASKQSAWPWETSANDHQTAFSNAMLAAVITLPLILTGAWMGRTMPNTIDRTWRMHGLMQPPVNPWLREEYQPRMKSHGWNPFGWDDGKPEPQPSSL